eukprot:GHVL01033921.1.p1 GENE.GHVL01033921.1~~GHVL01033921.1.p1  ORF type:complete len:1097 (+),score=164.13 GHVL01033921.1:518-3808(+)
MELAVTSLYSCSYWSQSLCHVRPGIAYCNRVYMCAQFHPRDDKVVSASLDQTVRIWDLTGLRSKTVSIGGSNVSTHHPDVFSTTDAVVQYVLEGHERGVNWACFHPTLPVVASGADDRTVRLWRYSESSAWESASLRGHSNNVSCVMFHPRKDILISNSEDRTTRIWDHSNKTCIHVLRRESDRFWVLTPHLTSSLLAVGHDGGMVIFKLERERPPFCVDGTTIYYVKDRFLQSFDINTGKTFVSLPCKKAVHPLCPGPKSIYFNNLNPTDISVLLIYDNQDPGGTSCYDLYTCPRNNIADLQSVSPASKPYLTSAAFCSRNRLAVSDKNGVSLYNLDNDSSKQLTNLPFIPTKVHSAANNRIILQHDDKDGVSSKLVLWDLNVHKSIGELNAPGGVRYIIWSTDGQYLAVLSKHNITLSTSKLDLLHSSHETIRLKSGAWDENGVFIYTTLSHLKYMLTNGDSGIINSLEDPIYIIRVHKLTMHYLDREQRLESRRIQGAEFLFKMALLKKHFGRVNAQIKTGRLCGNAIIGYLKTKGHPQIALGFVEDPKTRFNLALEFGYLQEAIKSAEILDDKEFWSRLGAEALRQGNYQIVEKVYQRTHNMEKLSFLYLITGNLEKLEKMLKIAEMRNDCMSRFHNAIMLGDVEERVKTLSSVGQSALALLTAKTYNLQAQVESIECGFEYEPSETCEQLTPLMPAVSPSKNPNWPTTISAEDIFKNQFSESQEEETFEDVSEIKSAAMEADEIEDHGGSWGVDIDIDIPEATPTNTTTDVKSFVGKGDAPQERWLKKQPVVADYVAVGNFEEALSILEKRIGLKKVNTRLKSLFFRCYRGTWCEMPGLPLTPDILLPILTSGNLAAKTDVPKNVFTSTGLAESIKSSLKFFSEGKVVEALDSFRECILTIPLCKAYSAEEESQLLEAIDICRNYIIALRLEQERRRIMANNTNAKRALELCAYFSCCKMKQPNHTMLALRVAMNTAYKLENFVTAAAFCKRIMEAFGDQQSFAEALTQVRKVLQIAEKKATNAHDIDFNTSEDLILCSQSLTRVNGGSPVIRCPFCNCVTKESFKGETCNTCEISELGARTLGMQIRPLM